MSSHFRLFGDEESGDSRSRLRQHLHHKYNGRKGYNGYSFHNPKATNEEIELRVNELGGRDRGKYITPEGDEIDKALDLDTYYSTTRKEPRRLIVQATDATLEKYHARHWLYRPIKGDVPLVIRLAEFCLNPLKHDDPRKKLSIVRRTLGWLLSTWLTIWLAWIIQVILLYDLVTAPWTDDGGQGQYDEYVNFQWDWPKHAINPLDQWPGNPIHQAVVAHLNIPRRLVVRDAASGEWISMQTEAIRNPVTGTLPRYIFLSFSRRSFPPSFPMVQFLHLAAERMVEQENSELRKGETPITAFWLDLDCVSGDDAGEMTKDINSICDAVRGAARVYVVLPQDTETDKRLWGGRVWTLPEALLSANKLRYCFPVSQGTSGSTQFGCRELTLTEMYETFWRREETEYTAAAIPQWAGIIHDDEISHLVKHFSNTLKLTDLQLFSVAVQALARRGTSADGKPVEGYTQTALAYAAMGLLAYRITPDPSDNNFQAIARLSLVNDNDQLLERLVCLAPVYSADRDEPIGTVAGSETILKNMAEPDQFETHLWDIKPICQIVGIGAEDYAPTIVLDQCHATPIRWKRFPRLKYVRDMSGFRASIAQGIVYYGSWFYGIGLAIAWNSIPLVFAIYHGGGTTQQFFNIGYYYAAMAFVFAVGWLISLFAPLAVRQLCEGNIAGNSCHLVGFEGTMSIYDIERLMFGNFRERLSYAPSSTPFIKGFRDMESRMGTEPNWDVLEKQLPPGQRFFTIIDTGDYTVSVIAAERPPTVALICGQEGGMLRVLLCSWRFENNCLYKESVMRMRSSLYDQTVLMDWLKISLASQGEVGRARQREANGMKVINLHNGKK